MSSSSSSPSHIIVDGNEAVASVAYRLNELIAIYPITPSSAMAESCDEWAAAGKPNLWGQTPRVVEMQSEGGAAGAVHGGLLGGALTTTFTASQGLLLMIPNLYKIAGELLPFTAHVSARALAAQALSIFGDHQDVMACRATGCALLCSNSPQEAHDMALVAHAASLRSRVPFIHFFDGFRTSHEVAKISYLSDEHLRGVIDEADIAAFRSRAMSPDRPTLRGTAQNPDVYFQGREAVNRFYQNLPAIVQEKMDRLAAVTGREYQLFDYHGHPEAERVIIAMGSAVETITETVDWLLGRGERVGVIAVRLFSPFNVDAFIDALPKTTTAIAVLDRTKEPGSLGEPLYLNVVGALSEEGSPLFGSTRVVGGRYGLGSKEFTPGMVKGVFDHLLAHEPRNHFTVGILDDLSRTSIPYEADFDLGTEGVRQCVFVGLGADGTVGANKNSIKIIGEQTENFAQGYFVYDSKKSGSLTTSHLRFGPRPIRAPYLIRQADFVACSQFSFVGRANVLGWAAMCATVLLNSPFGPEETWRRLPREWQQTLIDKKLRMFVVDATQVAVDSGMGRRTNTVLQTCFFALSGVLPKDEAIAQIKKSIVKTYGRKGEQIVKMNYAAVDAALAGLKEVKIPAAPDSEAVATVPPSFPSAPEFVQKVTARLLADEGDLMPVSAMPLDGCWPTGTAQYEKRNIALEIPVWDPALCIQCNKCVLVCPHAAIRAKFYAPEKLAGAPEGFASTPFRSTEFPGQRYTLQVAPEDCTGCSLCVQVCPAKDKTNPRHKAIDMAAQPPLLARERANWDFFLKLPDPDRTRLDASTVKGSQFMAPLFEFSGACAGCGETPYIKLLTQLVGDRLLITNATGCTSIYGGNLPTTPYCANSDGRGPTWVNSLFEDNAEAGLGVRLAVDQRVRTARELAQKLADRVGAELAQGLLAADQSTEAGIAAQRTRVGGLEGGAAPDRRPRRPPARGRRRRPRQEVGVDPGRRRLGLRHRLRRSRSCPRLRRQRQGAGPRHRGLFQHGRAGLEIDAHGRRREVRGRRQGDRQEGSRADRHAVRARLRGARGLRGKGQPDPGGAARGRCLRRPGAHHRLRPLHRARLPAAPGPRAAEARRRHRLLAALPVRSPAGRQRRGPAQARFPGAEGGIVQVHGERDALRHPEEHRAGARRRAGDPRPGGHQAPLRALPAARRAAVAATVTRRTPAAQRAGLTAAPGTPRAP